MTDAELAKSWFKDAIIYQLHVRAYHDTNGDGIGDLAGLIEKLDYIRDLGVTAIWLLPFYPSPLRDDGYDIADYRSINPSYGDLADFKRFLREAHRRDLRVITELVINHTSDQHEWFQKSRTAAPGSKWRNFYVWSDDDTKFGETRIIFRDFETSNWEWDPVAEAYYWHRFYKHQPDLNFDNPEVRDAVLKVLDFWAEMGVDGFRLDAVPYLIEREGTTCENLPETHAILKDVRTHLDRRHPNRMLLAEANQWPEDAAAYFGAGDECHMNFHFPLMPRLFMALQQEDRFPIIDILEQTPEIPSNCQWGIFLRNHDELTLEMVTDEERDYMYRSYAADPRARINLGIRRRLAPLLGNNRRKIELLNGLLLSLPGTPVIYYGDELGMGDNIYLGDRDGVRTPMQWSPDRNAGFSRSNPQRLYLPCITDPEFHFATVNVEAQENNPTSMLWWMRRIIALRKRYRVFGRGSIEFLFPDNPKVLAFLRRHENETALVVANLSRFSQYLELDLSRYHAMVPVEMFGQTRFPSIGTLPYLLTLSPHSFYWFILQPQAVELPTAVESRLPPVTLTGRFADLFTGKPRQALEQALAEFAKREPRYDDRTIQAVSLLDTIPLEQNGDVSTMLAVARILFTAGDPEQLVVPLRWFRGELAERLLIEHPERAVMRVLVGEEGVPHLVIDATREPQMCEDWLSLVLRQRTLKGASIRLSGALTKAGAKLQKAIGANAESLCESGLTGRVLERRHRTAIEDQAGTGQDDGLYSDLAYGEKLALRLYRHVDPGVAPDLELSRFLTQQAGFPHVTGLLGAIELSVDGREPGTLALLREQVRHEGTAWEHALDELGRYIERVLLPDESQHQTLPPGGSPLLESIQIDPAALALERIGPWLQSAELIGQRTAELHIALASERENSQYAPEPFTSFYQRGLYQSVRKIVRQSLQGLHRRLRLLDVSIRPHAEQVLHSEPDILMLLQSARDIRIRTLRTRCHGAYGLEHLLYTGRDFLIADMAGDPGQSLGERRIKRSPLLDAAGMIHSLCRASQAALWGEVSGIGTTGAVSLLRQWVAYWHNASAGAFLNRYLNLLRSTDLLPEDPAHVRLLLQTFFIERGCREVLRQSQHPGPGLKIALTALLELLKMSATPARLV
jgi:maltose alpha-D-glucosyltransferase/alpha-amylase